MSTTILPDAVLPLALMLGDGATGKFPQAEVYAAGGSLLGTYDLTHRARGLYTDDAQTMPASQPFVVAVYIVYDDAGHTGESATHLRSSDTFAQASYITGGRIVDGTVDVDTLLKRLNAQAAGKIVRDLAVYAYKAEDGVTTLFSLEDSDNERTPV